ncbi:GNAT family protein [Glutamicibacter sp. FBE19]|uniref:GNAT family N-acetyltransferase n=1 Tax=Glutamicibacter sp. FBE19 TaxID=2761534 RepID=UPI001896A45C|nr:GNAT family protein [Glutamicibacter sp. FBE19]MBF6673254.1 GNAT family N-acetyltransferase [Glutamicibacter sp. FBE19]
MPELTLRKLSSGDIDLIEENFQSLEGAGESQWFGFWDTQKLRTRLSHDQFIGGNDGALAICLGEQTIGKVDWFTVTSWGRANTSACWEIAIGIFAEHRGQGHGTQAQRLLADYLFAHYPRHRIQATTAAGNIAEQRSLEKAGFSREGVIRQSQWRHGRWHDQHIYSLLRHEFSRSM